MTQPKPPSRMPVDDETLEAMCKAHLHCVGGPMESMQAALAALEAGGKYEIRLVKDMDESPSVAYEMGFQDGQKAMRTAHTGRG